MVPNIYPVARKPTHDLQVMHTEDSSYDKKTSKVSYSHTFDKEKLEQKNSCRCAAVVGRFLFPVPERLANAVDGRKIWVYEKDAV